MRSASSSMRSCAVARWSCPVVRRGLSREKSRRAQREGEGPAASRARRGGVGEIPGGPVCLVRWGN